SLFSILYSLFFIRYCFIFKKQGEKDQYHYCKNSGKYPDVGPTVYPFIDQIVVRNSPCNPKSYQHAHPIGSKCDQSLGGTLIFVACLGIRIYLSGYKEKIITDPVQGNTQK